MNHSLTYHRLSDFIPFLVQCKTFYSILISVTDVIPCTAPSIVIYMFKESVTFEQCLNTNLNIFLSIVPHMMNFTLKFTLFV